jgi:hypothetical protein
MDYPKAHAVLHLAEPLSDGEVDELRLARLLVIDHDPSVVSAVSILTSVTRRGYAAQLIAR